MSNQKEKKLLSINSTIYEIEDALKHKAVREIAKEMRIGAVKLRQILTIVGYEYDVSTRKWSYILADDSGDQRHRTFWHVDHYGIGNTGNINDMDAPLEEEVDGNMSNIGNTEFFTADEIAILKQLAARHSNDITAAADSTDVLQALKKAPTGSTNKKTFALNDDIINQLDTFCDVHRVKKSDVLAVALQDFFKKHQ